MTTTAARASPIEARGSRGAGRSPGQGERNDLGAFRAGGYQLGPVAAKTFGAVEGLVGPVQGDVDICFALIRLAHPKADGDAEIAFGALEVHCLCSFAQAICKQQSCLDPCFWKDQTKFFAAKAAQQVCVSDVVSDKARQAHDNIIPGRMTVNVIHALEVVNIEHQDTERMLVSVSPLDLTFGEAEECAAIEGFCQRIGDGQIIQRAALFLCINEILHGVAPGTADANVLADDVGHALQEGDLCLCKCARTAVYQAKGAKAFTVRIAQWSTGEENDIGRARNGRFASEIGFEPGIGHRERFIGKVCGSTECLEAVELMGWDAVRCPIPGPVAFVKGCDHNRRAQGQ